MSTVIQRIQRPELFVGFVAPIGADLTSTVAAFRAYFQSRGYRVIEIKVTDIFQVLESYIEPLTELRRMPLRDRYLSYIAYGNQLREYFGDDAILAVTTIARIVRKRVRIRRAADEEPFSQTVFLLHQFKRKEEIDLLRSVYGRLFFQVSIYSRRGARVDWLSRRFASSSSAERPHNYRAASEEIIQRDENEVDEQHGQRVGQIFHDADFIVNLDSDTTVTQQVNRFCEIIFGSNSISPTKAEYGMFLAKSAALRTLDLARQVGAAILSSAGEIISLGSNEVPKGGGGSYWADEEFDDREYLRGCDSNDVIKQEVLNNLLQLIRPSLGDNREELDKSVRDSRLMDALEYARVVHAEMAAITDAARLGRQLKGGILYCTTFPCHMCAKHIIATGLDRVVFLEPYPKSLASDLHSDALQVEGADRGRYEKFPAVHFEHFYGVSPRRFRELFERGGRKDESGTFFPYRDGEPIPIIDIKHPFYSMLEEIALSEASEGLVELADTDEPPDEQP